MNLVAISLPNTWSGRTRRFGTGPFLGNPMHLFQPPRLPAGGARLLQSVSNAEQARGLL